MKQFFSLIIFLSISFHLFAQNAEPIKMKDGSTYYKVESSTGFGVQNSDHKSIIPEKHFMIKSNGSLFLASTLSPKYETKLYNKKGELLFDDDKERVYTFINYENKDYLIVNNDVYNYDGSKMLYSFKCDYSKSYVKEVLSNNVIIHENIYKSIMFIDGFFRVYVDKIRYGIIDMFGKEIIKPYRYMDISFCGHGFICKLHKYSEGEDYVDLKGNVIIKDAAEIYTLGEDRLCAKNRNNSYSIYDIKGKKLFDCQSRLYKDYTEKFGHHYFLQKDSFQTALSMLDFTILGNEPTRDYLNTKTDTLIILNKTYLAKRSKGKVTICDLTGRRVFKNLYSYTIDFKSPDDKIIMYKDGKCGVLDLNENIIIPFDYEYIYRDKHGYTVRKNGKEGVIDFQNNFIIPVKYDGILQMEDHIGLRMGDYEGFADITGRVRQEPKYDGYYWDKGTNLIKVHDGIYEGYCDINGKEIVPLKYNNVHFYKNYIAVEINGKHGYLDSKGNVIIPTIYDDIINTDDYFYVKDNETEGIYDKEGNMLFPTGLYTNVHISDRSYEYPEYSGKVIMAHNGDYKSIEYDLHGNRIENIAKKLNQERIKKQKLEEKARLKAEKRERRAQIWLGIAQGLASVADQMIQANSIRQTYNSTQRFIGNTNNNAAIKNMMQQAMRVAEEERKVFWNNYKYNCIQYKGYTPSEEEITNAYSNYVNAKVQANYEVYGNSTSESSYNSTISQSSSSSSSSSISSSSSSTRKPCHQCELPGYGSQPGNGNCYICKGMKTTTSGFSLDKKLCSSCGNTPQPGKCRFCNGTGWR